MAPALAQVFISTLFLQSVLAGPLYRRSGFLRREDSYGYGEPAGPSSAVGTAQATSLAASAVASVSVLPVEAGSADVTSSTSVVQDGTGLEEYGIEAVTESIQSGAVATSPAVSDVQPTASSVSETISAASQSSVSESGPSGIEEGSSSTPTASPQGQSGQDAALNREEGDGQLFEYTTTATGPLPDVTSLARTEAQTEAQVSSSSAPTEAAASSTSADDGQEIGSVPAVGVGEGNTSLLEVLSSFIQTASLAPISVSSQADEPQATDQGAAVPSSTSCSSTASLPAETATAVGPTALAITESAGSAQPSPVDPNPGLPSVSSFTVPAGQTVTLHISSTLTVSEIVAPTAGPEALTVPSSSEVLTVVTVTSSTLMTSIVAAPSEPATSSAPPLPASIDTAITVSPESVATSSAAGPAAESPTVLPSISIQTSPSSPPEATAAAPPPPPPPPPSPASSIVSIAIPAPVPGETNFSAMTIPLGDMTLVLMPAPAPTAAAAAAAEVQAGNSVVPVNGSFQTVTVTQTVSDY